MYHKNISLANIINLLSKLRSIANPLSLGMLPHHFQQWLSQKLLCYHAKCLQAFNVITQ